MKVKVTNAIKQLFGTTTSFDMVYYEAVANSLDANAKNINILIEADSTNDIENFKLTISDDGIGFTDNRYSKFGNLFDAEEASHRGVGRLVYLAYFDSVKIKSFYEDTKLRTIDFKEDFDETKDFEITDAIKNYANEKISKLEKYFGDNFDAVATLGIEGNEQVAEIRGKKAEEIVG